MLRMDGGLRCAARPNGRNGVRRVKLGLSMAKGWPEVPLNALTPYSFIPFLPLRLIFPLMTTVQGAMECEMRVEWRSNLTELSSYDPLTFPSRLVVHIISTCHAWDTKPWHAYVTFQVSQHTLTCIKLLTLITNPLVSEPFPNYKVCERVVYSLGWEIVSNLYVHCQRWLQAISCFTPNLMCALASSRNAKMVL